MFLSSTNPVILKIGSYQVFNFSTASTLVQKTKFCHLDYCNTFLTGLWLLLWTHLRVRLILLKYNKSFTWNPLMVSHCTCCQSQNLRQSLVRSYIIYLSTSSLISFQVLPFPCHMERASSDVGPQAQHNNLSFRVICCKEIPGL